MSMSKPNRKLELVCILCNQALASLQLKLLSEDHLENASETTTVAENDRQNGNGGGPFPQEVKSALLDREQVVATKCGHMFHQGCLRNHVHQSLDKGGSLFCPICTKPFAMNRLWPVIIPATKAQREKYNHYRLLKAQNAEMHHQLQEIRTKITDAEKELKNIKEDSEECLNDIQAKQKLLDSISGPTNQEMAELTKLHLKRQEILHVVTQHNADLLKLLAEESNLGAAPTEIPSNNSKERDYNENYVSSPRDPALPKEPQKLHSTPSQSELLIRATRKASRKVKKTRTRKTKSRRATNKRSQSRQNAKEKPQPQPSPIIASPHSSQNLDWIVAEDLATVPGQARHNNVASPGPRKASAQTTRKISPKKLGGDPTRTRRKGDNKSECRKVDTFMKWEVESLLEPMNECSSEEFSNIDLSSLPVPPHHAGKGKPLTQDDHDHDSVSILLARKPPMEKGGAVAKTGRVRGGN